MDSPRARRSHRSTTPRRRLGSGDGDADRLRGGRGHGRGSDRRCAGALRRTWTEGGRRYFHYVTDARIGNEYAFFSAGYAVHEEVARVAQAPSRSRSTITRRTPRTWSACSAAYAPRSTTTPAVRSRTRTATSGSSRIPAAAWARTPRRPPSTTGRVLPAAIQADDPRGLDFAVRGRRARGGAPVVGHQLRPRRRGSAAADRKPRVVLRDAGGGGDLRARAPAAAPALHAADVSDPAHPRRAVRCFAPPTRSRLPQGPVRAVRAERVHRRGAGGPGAAAPAREARSGAPPLPTSLDLYRELQAVTPDSLRYLLHDLFEANTFWELETERATAKQTAAGAWQVTLDVQARKVVVDPRASRPRCRWTTGWRSESMRG